VKYLCAFAAPKCDGVYVHDHASIYACIYQVIDINGAQCHCDAPEPGYKSSGVKASRYSGIKIECCAKQYGPVRPCCVYYLKQTMTVAVAVTIIEGARLLYARSARVRDFWRLVRIDMPQRLANWFGSLSRLRSRASWSRSQ
jgi:hypothetical protein